MIGVCIPTHNEQALIAHCLQAVLAAASHRALCNEPVVITVVLDGCTDNTAAIAAAYPVSCLSIPRSNVGIARAVGMEHLIQLGVRWLACTDADSCVSRSWLADQLALNADVVCGTVEVRDFSAYGASAKQVQRHFRQNYQDRDDHRHVHGCNLGMTPAAYLQAGGFMPLACSEDQALVDQLERNGARIAWSARPRVVTSARVHSRVEGGFASALRRTAPPSAGQPATSHPLPSLTEDPQPSAG